MKCPGKTTIAALSLAFLAAGCGGEEQAGDNQRTGSMTRQRIGQAQSSLPAEVSAKLDSGNSAYRAGDYERALELYRSATDAAPEAAAPWFGVYMAYNALGQQDSADAALERAGGLSESGGAFHGTGDSMPDSVPNPHQGMGGASGGEGGS
jgi:tetratricopeptide (TPR) repeat protein